MTTDNDYSTEAGITNLIAKGVSKTAHSVTPSFIRHAGMESKFKGIWEKAQNASIRDSGGHVTPLHYLPDGDKITSTLGLQEDEHLMFHTGENREKSGVLLHSDGSHHFFTPKENAPPGTARVLKATEAYKLMRGEESYNFNTQDLPVASTFIGLESSKELEKQHKLMWKGRKPLSKKEQESYRWGIVGIGATLMLDAKGMIDSHKLKKMLMDAKIAPMDKEKAMRRLARLRRFSWGTYAVSVILLVSGLVFRARVAYGFDEPSKKSDKKK